MEYDGKYSKNNKNNINTQNRNNPNNNYETSNSRYGRGIDTVKSENKSDYSSQITNVNRIFNVPGGGCGQSTSSIANKDGYSRSLLSRMKGLSQQNTNRENKENKQDEYVKKDLRNITDSSSIYSKFSTKDNTNSTFENYSINKDLVNKNQYSNSVLDNNLRFLNDANKPGVRSYNNRKDLKDNISDNIYKSMTGSNVFEAGGGNVDNRSKYGKSNGLDYLEKEYKFTYSKEKLMTSKLICDSKIGLDNLGNTCYINTSLQCLIHCEPFMKKFFGEKEKYFGITSVKSTNISRAFHELCVSICEKIETKSSISPFDFKRIISQAHNNFAGYRQHDTQEFLRLLLEDISGELNRIINTPKYSELETSNKNKRILNSDFDKLFRSREDSIVIDTFYGQIENIFKCIDCNYETYSFEKFFDIPLLLENESYSGFLLTDLLNDFFKSDRFNWDVPCENKRCKKKSIHEKFSKLSILPEVLVLSLQRYNSRRNTKINSKVKILEVLEMSNYVDKDIVGKILINQNEGNNKSRYNLFAVSNHSGTLDFGHYYAYIKLFDGWFEFNDSYVSKIYNMNYESNISYVLFYKREGI